MWKRLTGWWRKRRERRRVYALLWKLEGQLRLAERVNEAHRAERHRLGQQYLLLWEELDRTRRLFELERRRWERDMAELVVWLGTEEPEGVFQASIDRGAVEFGPGGPTMTIHASRGTTSWTVSDVAAVAGEGLTAEPGSEES